MQVMVTIGEDGRATAQILGSETTVERTTGHAEALDGGTARAFENEPKSASAVRPAVIDAGGLDGGAAPAELREAAPQPQDKARARPEAGPFEDTSAGPTIVDVFSTRPRRSRPASIQ